MNKGATRFEFGEAADEKREGGFANVSFGGFGLAGDVEVEGGDEFRVEVIDRCLIDSWERSSSTGFVPIFGYLV